MSENVKGRRILVADDNAVSRRMLESLLGKWGFDVLTVSDGRQACEELAQAGAPTLALLDWEMPCMDGVQVCRKVRAIETDTPPYLIMLTGRDTRTDVVKGLDAGANDYITKPFDRAELRARLEVGRRMLDLQEQLKRTRDALAYEALHDPLTGCFNRRAIMDTLRKELVRAERGNHVLSIGLCDIDHFKHVNDTYGHQAGDDVLRAFAGMVQDTLRVSDHLGRYGGEEFLVIATEAENDVSGQLYERLRRKVDNTPIATEAGSVHISVTIGVVRAKGREDVDELIAAADAALYEGKRNGRNCVVTHSPETRGEP